MQQCGGVGGCIISRGLCSCYPGYAGEACESCASGYIQNNGQCLPALPGSIVSSNTADGDSGSSADPLPTWIWVAVVCGSLAMLALLVAAFYMGRFKTMARIFTEVHLPRMSQMYSTAGGDFRPTIRQSQAGVTFAQDVQKHSMHGAGILDDPRLERRQTGMVPPGSIMVNQLPPDYFSQSVAMDSSFVHAMPRRSSAGGALRQSAGGGMLEPHYNYSAGGGIVHSSHSYGGGVLENDPYTQPAHHEPAVRMNTTPTVHLVPPRQSAFASAVELPAPSAPPMHSYNDPRMTGEVHAFFGGSSPSMARASGTGEQTR